MLPDLTTEEFAAALDEIAITVLAAAEIDTPPVDTFRLAESLGVVVAMDNRQSGRARYVRVQRLASTTQPLMPRHIPEGQASIMMRSEPRHERRQWAVAHELGEHLAAEVFQRLGCDASAAAVGSREMVASALANRLLLPTPWLARDGLACDWDLALLKARYTTASHELLARRMLDFDLPVIVTVWDNAKITFRRSNLAGRASPLLPGEQDCWRERAYQRHIFDPLSA